CWMQETTNLVVLLSSRCSSWSEITNTVMSTDLMLAGDSWMRSSRSFVDIKCALLPDPGRNIRRGSEGNITVNDMDPDFKDELQILVKHMFDKLVCPKEVNTHYLRS
ncbi:hypothetical protein PENTCL1PPCAC_10445, partial [Pristionchus entomophagus]